MKMLDRLFREDETMSPRLVVGGALLAFALALFAPQFGMVMRGLVSLIALILLVAPAYMALRFLVPMMDPRDAEADRFAVWGGLVLLLVVGFSTFGLMTLPALALAGLLLWKRAPELMEPFERFSGPKANY
ncbi:hypothetical protein [Algicella marina]|uniref:Uncharacterized protein n=1 Tax=Algicella marina TaxID=2683284 RepID=A0A6P1T2Z4_9RHOB|nr:hypothetical protein [Algicella marina]QHQ36115.1 hypothetical protein GO499_13515 [Algicella marina]